jgi:hypothetical protein
VKYPIFLHWLTWSLGYTVPAILLSLVGISQNMANDAFTLLKAVLILHVVAAGLAFVSLLFCFFLASQAFSIVRYDPKDYVYLNILL